MHVFTGMCDTPKKSLLMVRREVAQRLQRTERTVLTWSRQGRLELIFIPSSADLPLRDQRDTMERPFFSLAKTKRLMPIDYVSPDKKAWVKVSAHPEFGMATIWDADVLIWAASTLMEMKNRGLKEPSRTLQFLPFIMLPTIGRKTGGAEYHWLRGALARLQATVVRTNIRAKGRRKEAQFGWIESWTDLTDEVTGESLGMAITVSEWFYAGVLMEGGSLAVDPAYFNLTGGRERWLYRVARKHAGGHGGEGWAISIPTLFVKSGAEGSYRRFKLELRRVAERDALPEYHLVWEEHQSHSREPMLRMTKRSKLDITHPAFEIPQLRRRCGPSPAPSKRT